MRAVFKREIRAYFFSPLGYVFIAAYFFFGGFFFFNYNLYGNSSDLRGLFNTLFTVTLFLAPILTMRLMSEDRKQKTDIILLTAPVRAASIVLGKLFAALCVYVAAISVTLVCAVVVFALGTPDIPLIIGHFAGLFLLGSALISIGMMISALTENQIIAAVGGFGVGFFFMLLESLAPAISNEFWGKFVSFVAFGTQYSGFTLGVLKLTSLVFFVSVTALFTFITVCVFEKRRWRMNLGFPLLLVFAVIVVVLLNGVLGLADERRSLEIDMTKGAVFELSPETKDFVAGFSEPVTAYMLARESTFKDVSVYNAQANEVLSNFGKLSDDLKIEYVDFVKNPGFAANYPDLSMKEGDILFVCGEKHRLLRTEELFVYTRNNAGQLAIASSRAEEAIAAALLVVTSKESPLVTLLGGHGEYVMESFQILLERNNYLLETQNLATGSFDPESKIAVMIAPKTDYSESELKKLDAFLYNDGAYGRTLFYCADAAEQPPLPNLEAFLREWGVQVGGGAVFETNENRVYNYQPYYAVADYAEEDYSSQLRTSSISVLMPLARPLETVFEHRENYETKTLLVFGADTGVRPVDASADFSADDATQRGPFPALILCRQGAFDRSTGMLGDTSRVLVSASAGMLDGYSIDNSAFANAAYLTILFGDFTGQENTLKITPKTLTGGPINLSMGAAEMIGTIFVLVIPLAILAAGVVIWLYRRRA